MAAKHPGSGHRLRCGISDQNHFAEPGLRHAEVSRFATRISSSMTHATNVNAQLKSSLFGSATVRVLDYEVRLHSTSIGFRLSVVSRNARRRHRGRLASIGLIPRVRRAGAQTIANGPRFAMEAAMPTIPRIAPMAPPDDRAAHVQSNAGCHQLTSATDRSAVVAIDLKRLIDQNEKAGFLLPPCEPSMRILIVDDEANIRKTLRIALEAAKHSVEEAAGVPEALRQFERAHFDLALVDLKLGARIGIQPARDAGFAVSAAGGRDRDGVRQHRKRRRRDAAGRV